MKRLLALAAALLAAGCTQMTGASAPPTYTAAQYQPAQPSPAVRDAQQRLQAQGFYSGPIDGIEGPETMAALQRFQRARGLAANGELDTATVAALHREPGRAAISSAVALSDPAAVQQLQARLRQLGLYAGPVDGAWGPETRAALQHFQSVRGLDPTGVPTRATVAALGLGTGSPRMANLAQPLDPAVIRTVQLRLRRAGFYSGAADGVWGQQSTAALERFQRSRGLEPSGELNPTTVAALGLNPNDLAAASPPGGGYGSSLPPR